MVMAAGLGSRYGGIKQMAGMGPGGEILMEYSLYDALEAGFDDAVVILRPDIVDDFRLRFGHRIEKRFPLRYAVQSWDTLPGGFVPPEGRRKPYGTVHALLSAANVIDNNFAVINADDYYGKDAYRQIRAALDALPESGQMCMVAYELGKTLSENGGVARGICHCSGGYLDGIEELRELAMSDDGLIYNAGDRSRAFSPQTLISMNIWGGTPWLMGELEKGLAEFLNSPNKDEMSCEYVLPHFVGDRLAAGELKVAVMQTAEQWYGVTYKEDRQCAADALGKMHDKGCYPSPLFP